MPAGPRRWQELNPSSRRLLITLAAVEGALKTAALIDLSRRAASEIRGPKWMWAAIVALINAFGAAPVAYFAFARRRPSSPPSERKRASLIAAGRLRPGRQPGLAGWSALPPVEHEPTLSELLREMRGQERT